jgi:hypothetical protein
MRACTIVVKARGEEGGGCSEVFEDNISRSSGPPLFPIHSEHFINFQTSQGAFSHA